MIIILNNLIPLIITLFIFFSLFRCTYIIINNIDIKIYKEIINLFFIIYIVCLFYILTYESINPYWVESNYTLFKEIFRYKLFSKMFIKEVIGNILLFIPYGWFIAYFFQVKKIYINLLFCLIICSSIELIQIKIGRVFDIDDIFLNVLGSIIGYFLFKLKRIEK